MSLSGHLRDPQSPLGGYLREKFGHGDQPRSQWRSQLATAATILPPGGAGAGYPYAAVGTTMSWRLGFALGEMPLDVAETGFEMWRELAFGEPRLQKVADGLYLNQRTGETVEGTVAGSDMFDQLQSMVLEFCQQWGAARAPLDAEQCQTICQLCWGLALLDQVRRAGAAALQGPLAELDRASTVDDLLGLAPDQALADCCQLAATAQRPLIDAFANVPSSQRHLDPAFTGSSDVGGADADFILGDCLLDCKTTQNVALTPSQLRTWIWQLVGYTALDYDDTYGIHRAGIYLARQGRQVIWPLPELLSELSGGSYTSIAQVRSEVRGLWGKRGRKSM